MAFVTYSKILHEYQLSEAAKRTVLKAMHFEISVDEALLMKWHSKENGVPFNHILKSLHNNAFNTLPHTLVSH